jgi:hypothetical protein
MKRNMGWKITMALLFVFQVITNFYLLRTSMTDPGIIPGRVWSIKGGKLPQKYSKASKSNRVFFWTV